MGYIYSFCSYFSLRLGGIIIGIISLFQGVALVVTASIWLNDPGLVSSTINSWRKQYTLDFMTSTMETIQLDPEKYLIVYATLSSFYTLTCVMLMYGAYTCNTYMIYPYLVMELFRIIFLTVGHVINMMIFKENIINLGLLIGWTILGGFCLLGLVYMWFCVLSLVQLIRRLIKEIEIIDITNFPQKPAKNDVFSVRDRMAYRY